MAWTAAFLDRRKKKWLFGYKQTRIVDLMLSYIHDRKDDFRKILDVGCGSGRNTIALAKLGFEAYGIDFVAPAINELNRRAHREGVKVRSIVHDLTEPWPFDNDCFDAAIINVVLDSISRKDRFFVAKELHRVIRNRGLVFIYEPSVNDGYYGQFIDKRKKKFTFICPDDGIKREVFTKESLIQPFQGMFKVKFIQERRYEGKMFWRKYERAWWFAVLENIKEDGEI